MTSSMHGGSEQIEVESGKFCRSVLPRNLDEPFIVGECWYCLQNVVWCAAQLHPSVGHARPILGFYKLLHSHRTLFRGITSGRCLAGTGGGCEESAGASPSHPCGRDCAANTVRCSNSALRMCPVTSASTARSGDFWP